MKNSLGTLAAVAALAAAATTTTVSANVQYATHLFGSIIDDSNSSIDIDNDGIADYHVINGNRLQGVYHPLADLQNVIAVDGSQTQSFAFGDTIGFASSYNSYGFINLVMPGIVGLGFYTDESLHYAWLQFSMEAGDLIIRDGAWETSADTPLGITAVPEPTTMAAGIALLAGAAALLRRRSRRNTA